MDDDKEIYRVLVDYFMDLFSSTINSNVKINYINNFTSIIQCHRFDSEKK